MLYSYFFDHTSFKVLIQNDADHPIQIPRNHRLSYVMKIFYESCFATSVDYDAATIPLKSSPLFHERNGITIQPANKRLETELPNGIKIYRDSEVIQKLRQLVNEYPTIWESSKFV